MATEHDNMLVDMILNDRINGKSYLEIEKKHGIPAQEAMGIVREALARTASQDPVEYRQLVVLRTERVIDKLWQGLDNGSFKHGEAIIKALERLSDLLDLNLKTIRHELTIITDQQTVQVLQVLDSVTNSLEAKVRELPLNQKAVKELDAWPIWKAAATTEAVESIIDAEFVEVED